MDIPLSRAERRALQRATRKPTSPRREKKPILRDPMGWLVETLTPMTQQDGGNYVLMWKVRVHGAMQLILQGKARKNEVNDIVAAWNITSALCNIHHKPDPSIITSKEAIKSLCERSNAMGRVVAKANEINALNELVDLHDAWIESITVGQMEEALAWCRKHEHAGDVLRGKDIPTW